MSKKALIEYEGNTYWIDLEEWKFEIKDTQGFRELAGDDAFGLDVMQYGHVIGDKKPE